MIEHAFGHLSGLALRDESNYHFKFSQIYSPPKKIARLGDIQLLNHNLLSIVGPRQASPYAEQVMKKLFEVLPQYDVVTVSGLAPGVDMMCHNLSLSVDVPTIAVLGGGIDYFLRSRQREDIHRIVQAGGLIVSEFEADQTPERYTFPQRNRIVAGLSESVFLPEAGVKSGSLITVDFARQMHKMVYGTPQNIFVPGALGLHQYMQQGLIQPVVDFHQMLSRHFGKRRENFQSEIDIPQGSLFDLDEGEEKILLSIFKKNPHGLTITELVRLSGLGIDEVMSELGILEVMGQVRSQGDKWMKG